MGTERAGRAACAGPTAQPAHVDTTTGNAIGPNVAAESIDVREPSTGGTITGNTFLGAGMSGEHCADSWLDLKGNGYSISDNTGSGAPQDGYQDHVAVDGWGENNVFRRNASAVDAPGSGLSNVACQP